MGETSAAADDTEQATDVGPEADAAPQASPAGDGPAAPRAALPRARVLAPLYALVAMALTWPLTLHLGSHLAYGSEPTTTVPLFNLWTLRWDQDRLAHGLSGYWDAPLFHPTAGTFALSEPQPLTGLAFAPLSWVTGNPVLAFNLVALGILVLNGWFGARLARHLGVADGPAALTGVLAMGVPFVASQMGVLQLTAIFPLLALVDALLRWAPHGGRRPAGEVGAWLAVTFLTCGYYGLFAVVAVLPPAVLLARRDWFRRSRAVDVLVAALCFAPAVPFLLMQARITDGYERSGETIRELSAQVADLFELTGDALGAGFLPWVRDGGDDLAVYSGTALLILGVAGAVVLRRQAGERLRVFAFLVVGALLSVLLALGLNLSVFGFEPYQLIRDLVPGYHSLRSPFRFVAVAEVFLVALAAFGIDDLWRWKAKAGAAAAIAVVALGALEVSLAPVELFEVDRSEADWVAWLHEHRDDREEVVAFLPFPLTGKVSSYAPTARHMLQVLDAGDGVTTVNGYSGLWPEPYEELEAGAINYPTGNGDILFRDYGVTLLVVDAHWLAERPDVEQVLEYVYQREFTGPDNVVYAVPPPGGAVVPG
jgi:hypothetical protein